jgi:hypothetical protein
MSGTILSLPQYAFLAWYSVKAQGQLYLYVNTRTVHVIFLLRVLTLLLAMFGPTLLKFIDFIIILRFCLGVKQF